MPKVFSPCVTFQLGLTSLLTARLDSSFRFADKSGLENLFAIKSSEMRANLAFDLTFPHSYKVVSTELPRNGVHPHPPIYFPAGTKDGGKDGLLLRFTTSNGNEWSGCFAFGDYELCGVFASPHPDRVCVVSNGTGYWVQVDDPEKSAQLDALPIRDVRIVSDAQIMLVADFTSLSAIGSDGQLWRHRVCWDDLRILDIQQGIVFGTGYDPTNSQCDKSQFAVELATGRILQSPWS
jgi:hypothetical protein